jgi:hypothetical protein
MTAEAHALEPGIRAGRLGQRVTTCLRAIARHWPGLLLATSSFVVYAYFRARYVGGCDGWAYLSHAHLLRGLSVGLEGSLDPVKYPALVPLCYELAGRNVVPGMPPGYSFELAAGGLFGAEFFVSPCVGALTVWLLYFLGQRHAGRGLAALVAVLWASSPIVIWGATGIMSDLSAACGLLVTEALLQSGYWRSAGFALGASAGIRPTNMLFAVSLFQRSWRERLFFAAGVGVALAYWFVFGLGRYGPHMFGMYGANAQSVTYERAAKQLAFFARTSFQVFPLLLPLAVAGALTRFRERAHLVVWAAAIVAFYAGWRWPYTFWWWIRHILPAYPAMALLALHGAGDVYARLRPRLGRGAVLLTTAAASLNLAYNIHYSFEHRLLVTDTDVFFERDSIAIRHAVGERSLVGALTFSGALRFYGGIESFRSDSPDAPRLIDDALASGRRVYIVVEPHLSGFDPAARSLRERYRLSGALSLHKGYKLARVRPKAEAD